MRVDLGEGGSAPDEAGRAGGSCAQTGSYLGEISPAPENLLNRNFNATAPNQKWLTDISEFQLPAGKVYLSPMNPDDETIWCGATIAALAAAGQRVEVVSATNGGNPVRRDEFARACLALGARPTMFDLADNKRAELSLDDGTLADWLHVLRPSLVLSHGADGELHRHRHHTQCAALVARWTRTHDVPFLAFAPFDQPREAHDGTLRQRFVSRWGHAKQAALAVYVSQATVIASLAAVCGPSEAFSGTAQAMVRLLALAPDLALLDEKNHE